VSVRLVCDDNDDDYDDALPIDAQLKTRRWPSEASCRTEEKRKGRERMKKRDGCVGSKRHWKARKVG
jgi:hypothetical protein